MRILVLGESMVSVIDKHRHRVKPEHILPRTKWARSEVDRVRVLAEA